MKNFTFQNLKFGRSSFKMLGFLALFAMLPVTGSLAQTGTIGIGAGTAATSTALPVRANYGYTYSQQIVTAAEFAAGGGVAGPITKIRYYLTNAATPLTSWNNWTLYMGHTTKTSFASGSDWVPVANLTPVFTGTVTQVANSWIEITLTTPFNYDGVSNLVVAADENAADYVAEVYWGSYTGAANSGISYYSDSTNPNPASPPTASTRTATLARIQFVGNLASCVPPTGVTASGIGVNTANLSWTASQTTPASGYDYYYGPATPAPTATTTPSGSVAAGTTTASLTGLTSNTAYSVWVRSNCGGGDMSPWSAAATFTTMCDAVGIPYVIDFEEVTTPALPACTVAQNVGTGNNWRTVSPAASGFTNKALGYTYNSSNAANAWFMTRGLNLTAGTSYRISYRYGASSASTSEKMKVAYGTSPTAAAMTTVLKDHTLINNTTPITNTIDFVPATSGVYYIGFNVYSAANLYTLYIDDISVNLSPSCLPPTALTASNVTTTSGTVNWTAAASASAGYQYYYSTTNTAPTASTPISGVTNAGVTTATIADLAQASTVYLWVRSDCGSGSYSEWAGPVSFTTPCEPTSVPYMEDFESVTTPALPQCTAIQNVGTGNNWKTASPAAYGFTSKALNYSYNSSNAANAWFFTRGITLTAGTSYRLSYLYGASTTSTTEKMKVAYGMQPNAAGMTTVLMDHTAISNSTAATKVIDFTPATSGVYYFGFNVYSAANMYSLYVDDIMVDFTPSCLPPTTLTASNVTTTAGTVSWPAATTTATGGYQFYYSTDNTAPSPSTPISGVTNPGVLTTTIADQAPATTLYIWVRTDCGSGSYSAWTGPVTFTTLCEPSALPYVEDFESVTTPAIPVCTAIQNAGTGNNWKTASPAAYGFTSKALNYTYNSTNAANAWFFTRGVTLTAGTSYRISYRYGASLATTSEKMKVAYGTQQNAASMTTVLMDHTLINNNSALTKVIDFIPTTSGIYYFGFNVYSAANLYSLYVDDIKVDVTPSCLPPTAIAASNIGETGATVSWTASTTTPSGGYQYYYSTDSTAPTAATTISGVTGAGVVTFNMTSLPSATKFYLWVRSDCGSGSYSEWAGPLSFSTLCDAPEIVSTTPATICGQGSAALQATASAGQIRWFTNATGGMPVGTGATFNTPQIAATTTYYVDAMNGVTSSVGAQYTGTSTNSSYGSHGLMITTTQPGVTINTIDIPFTGTGTITVAVKNTANTSTIVSATSAEVTGQGATAVTIPFNLTIPEAGSYLLVVNSVTGSVTSLGYSTATYPLTTADGAFSITNGYWYSSTASNMYLYNLSVTAGCASPRQAVTATVNSAVPITASAATPAICAGGSTNLSVQSANANYTYVWTPGNLTGATQTVSPAQTTTYTVTATDSSANCVTSQTVTVTVNPVPANFSAGADVNICSAGTTQALTATNGTTVNTLVSENFNAATNNWTTVNNSTGGTIAAAAWTLRASGYDYDGDVFRSNDNSQFYMTNSDAQGTLSTTSTILRSPSFSTVGYNSVNVTMFHHFYEPAATGATGKVEASTNGTDWTTLQTYNATTGGYTAFAQASVALTAAFLNQPTVYIRFKYDGGYRYYWSIDNIAIVGEQTAAVTWAPVTGLFTNADATTAYTGQPASTVYAMPSATTTYTATATNALSCSVTDQLTVTVGNTPAPTGQSLQTVSVSDPFNATIANLSVTATGTVVWYASQAEALAGTNPMSPNDMVADNGTYYAVQIIGSCPSAPFAVTVDVVLGNESFDVASFSYYPNPVKDVLTFKHSSDITSVAVFNLLGQQVLAKKINATEGTVDMSALADGPYVVNIMAGGTMKTVKVVKKQ